VRRAIFLASVQDDLIRILAYIARTSGSLSVAQRFVREPRDYCHRLAGLPGTMGQARPGIRADLGSTPYKNYVVFFRYIDAPFEVVNILEGHRDIIAYFEDEALC
jgi:plasmid stabilization system protein ParE